MRDRYVIIEGKGGDGGGSLDRNWSLGEDDYFEGGDGGW